MNIYKLFSQQKFNKVIELIKQDKQLNKLYEDGSNLLHNAAYYNQIEIINILLDKGFDIDAKDNNGHTPLFNATNNDTNDCKDAIKLLIENGANVNEKDKYGFPLFFNMFRRVEFADTKEEEKEYIALIELMLENGLNVNIIGIGGQTTLHRAVIGDHEEVAKLLLEKGTELNAVYLDSNLDENSPLTEAIRFSAPKLIKLYVDNGALEKSLLKNGMNYLSQYILHNCNLDTFKHLVRSGLDINELNANGTTPLMIAVSQSSEDIVKYLVKQGAKLEIKSNSGDTALSIAEQKSLQKESYVETNKKGLLTQEEIDALLYVTDDSDSTKTKITSSSVEKYGQSKKDSKKYKRIIKLIKKGMNTPDYKKGFLAENITSFIDGTSLQILFRMLSKKEIIYMYLFSTTLGKYKILNNLSSNARFLLLEDSSDKNYRTKYLIDKTPDNFTEYIKKELSKDILNKFMLLVERCDIFVGNNFNLSRSFKEPKSNITKKELQVLIDSINHKGFNMYENSENIASVDYYKEDLSNLVIRCVNYAMDARRDGILHLEETYANEKNMVLKKYMVMLIDGNELNTITEVLDIEIEYILNHFKESEDIDTIQRNLKIIKSAIISFFEGDAPRVVEFRLSRHLIGHTVYESIYD
ncbi:ankyrin repeat domain-containing protein [Sulfurimonas sp.]